jgi:hypothetical protein
MGDISEEEAGEGAIPAGGWNTEGSTTLRKSDLEREPLRSGVKGRSGVADRVKAFSFASSVVLLLVILTAGFMDDCPLSTMDVRDPEEFLRDICTRCGMAAN